MCYSCHLLICHVRVNMCFIFLSPAILCYLILSFAIAWYLGYLVIYSTIFCNILLSLAFFVILCYSLLSHDISYTYTTSFYIILYSASCYLILSCAISAIRRFFWYFDTSCVISLNLILFCHFSFHNILFLVIFFYLLLSCTISCNILLSRAV